MISGNGVGLELGGNSNVAQGNFIGTDVTGKLPLPNESDGIDVSGTNLVEGNIVAANGNTGIYVDGTQDAVYGNYIGTDVTGTVPLGNQGDGIFIGGANNGISDNVIAANGGDGVQIFDSPGSETQGIGVGW